MRSVLITSCLPDEGKTTVSLNLSVVLASGVSSSVILIDADLRRRSLTSSLGLNGRPGLANLLAGDGELKACLLKTQVDNLLVLPAGSRVQNPAELIASVRMRTVLQELKEQHESAYVIIDSTPIVSTSEPNVLTELVDGVLLVIRAERTRRDIVKRELKSADLRKVLGVVLNGANFEASQYYRKYYTYEPDEKR
jgi:capsular exopolysaccharide synthesis family protein